MSPKSLLGIFFFPTFYLSVGRSKFLVMRFDPTRIRAKLPLPQHLSFLDTSPAKFTLLSVARIASSACFSTHSVIVSYCVCNDYESKFFQIFLRGYSLLILRFQKPRNLSWLLSSSFGSGMSAIPLFTLGSRRIDRGGALYISASFQILRLRSADVP